MSANIERQRFLSDVAVKRAKARTRNRLILALAGCATVFVVVLFVVSVLQVGSGNFTVNVGGLGGSEEGLSLSETFDFANPVLRLNAKPISGVDNISGDDIPSSVNNIDGAHNGLNYFAYTFYVMNVGSKTVSYEYSIKMSDIERDIDEAIRYRIYYQDRVSESVTTYAKVKSDGSGQPEYGTEAFITGSLVVQKTVSGFEPGDIAKFTVVIWLEGDDPDCKNNLMGGRLRSDMYVEIRDE